MSDPTGWRYDERATSIYQKVFGPFIVDRVLIDSARYGLSASESIVEDDGCLPTHGEVILVLCNRRRVRLWTSEWGGATKIENGG